MAGRAGRPLPVHLGLGTVREGQLPIGFLQPREHTRNTRGTRWTVFLQHHGYRLLFRLAAAPLRRAGAAALRGASGQGVVPRRPYGQLLDSDRRWAVLLRLQEEKPLPNPVSEAKAVAKNIRCTPRKARLVIDLVRGKSVSEAVAILKNLNKAAALPVLKVIQSAASNAINNFNLDDEKLYIKEIYASDGMRMKRYLPRAKGSASGLVKRMCHITCVVKEKK